VEERVGKSFREERRGRRQGSWQLKECNGETQLAIQRNLGMTGGRWWTKSKAKTHLEGEKGSPLCKLG